MVSLQEAPRYIWIFALIGILGGISVLINTELRQSIPGAQTANTIYNETVSITDSSTLASLDHINLGFGNYTNVVVTNATVAEAEPLASGNYTLTATGIYMGTGADGANWDGQDINVTYTYQYYTDVGLAIENATLGVTNLTKQLPTVGTVVGVSLIVAVVVLMFFYFRKKGRGF